jgi:hypothetical protein
MRVYLSGPMTGYTDNNFPAFHAFAAQLRDCGYDVVNPAEINSGTPEPAPDSPEWREFYLGCLRADIKALCDCQAIALMPGWEQSNGAHLELHVAHRLGLRVKSVGELLETHSV